MNTGLILFWEECRGTWKRLVFFSLCLALGVAGVSGVASFGGDVKSALEQNSRLLLGGDMEMSDIKPLDPLLTEAAKNHESVEGWSQVNKLTAMASLGSEKTRLVEIFAFEGEYPLVPGTLRAEPEMRPLDPGQVWADAGFLDSWGLGVGDSFLVAGESYQVAAKVTEDLARDTGLFAFGPRIYMLRKDASKQGLLGKTSRFKESLFVLSTDTVNLKKDIKTLFPGAKSDSVRFVLPNDEDRSSNRLLKNLQFFLSQVALSTLVLIGLGVSTSLGEIIRQKIPDTAIYRALGAHPKLPSRVMLGVLVSVCAVGVGLGVLLGEVLRAAVFAPQMQGLFPVPLRGFSLANIPIFLPLVGLLLPLCFLWPVLSGLERIPPSTVLRGFDGLTPKLRWTDIAVWVLGLGMLLALFVTSADRPWVGVILFSANLTLFLLFKALLGLILKLARNESLRLPTSLELAFAEISSRQITSLLSMALLGIGLFILATVAFLKGDFVDNLAQDIQSKSKPNLYFIDVQKSQQNDLESLLKGLTQGNIDQAPMIRARLTHVGGKEVSQLPENDPSSDRMRQREQNLTWKQELGGAEEIEQGDPNLQGLWVPQKDDQVSLETRFAERIGATLGTELDFLVSGVPIKAKVTSIRKVNWQSFRPNFFVIVHPNLMEGVPHQVLMSAFGASLETRSQIQGKVAQEFPNVSVIDATAILERVRKLSEGIVKTIQLLSGLLTVSAFLILVASLLSTRQARRKSAALLRALGASSKLIRRSLAFEFALMGAASGLLGVGAAQIVGQILSRSVLEIAPSVDWATAGSLWLGSLLVTLVVGYLSCRSVLNTKPAQVLRETAL